MLVDSRVLLLRFCRFGLAFLRIVPLNLCKSNFARFPHFTSLVIQEFLQRRYTLHRQDCSHGLGRFMADHGIFLQSRRTRSRVGKAKGFSISPRTYKCLCFKRADWSVKSEAFNKTFNLRVAMGEDGLYGDVKM